MRTTHSESSTLRSLAAVAAVFFAVACGAGGSDDKGGGGGKSDNGQGGNAGDSGNGNGGSGDEPGTGGKEGTQSNTGGKQTGGTSNSTDNDGSGGTSSTGGAGGTSSTGGTNGTGGAVGTGGAPATGGAAGVVDKTKERVWIKTNVTFGPNGSIEHNQPSNWFAPIDYYGGSMEVRAIVSEAPSGTYGFELCLYKASPNDALHNCLPIAYNLKGTGEILKTNKATRVILKNPLVTASFKEADYMTPWAYINTRLIGTQHIQTIPGPVKTHLTIVLVPKGQTFSGWANYPK